MEKPDIAHDIHEVTASIRIYIGFLSFSFIGFLAMKAFHRLLRMSGIEAKIVNNHHPGTKLGQILDKRFPWVPLLKIKNLF